MFLYSCVCVHLGGSARTRKCAFARVAVLTRHATLLRHIVIFASLAPPSFSTLFHKRHDFRKQVTGHKTCLLIFSITYIRNKLKKQIYQNPSSGSRVVQCGRTDGRTHVTMLKVDFRNFAKSASRLSSPK